MKEIKIISQEQLDALKEIAKDETVIIESSESLKLKIKLNVFGILKIKCNIDCSRWADRYFIARGNSSVVAWGNSSVEARENSSVKTIRGYFKGIIKLFGFSVAWKYKTDQLRIEKNGANCIIQEFTDLPYLEREGVPVVEDKVILYKRVSHDAKTQENTKNETLWIVDTTVSHPAWNPGKEECGPGKFHACSRPYFCDNYRNTKGDYYIAIEVKVNDLHEHKDNPHHPHHPHKIAFRECKVLYKCNRFGNEIKAA